MNPLNRLKRFSTDVQAKANAPTKADSAPSSVQAPSIPPARIAGNPRAAACESCKKSVAAAKHICYTVTPIFSLWICMECYKHYCSYGKLPSPRVVPQKVSK